MSGYFGGMTFQISDTPPTPADFIALRADCGWGDVTLAQAEHALAHSIFHATARDGGRLIAMGRVVGDGALYFYLQDIVVRPSHRRQGLGEHLTQFLLDAVRSRASRGATIGLMSAKGIAPLYERFGFTTRPDARLGPGMTQVLA